MQVQGKSRGAEQTVPNLNQAFPGCDRDPNTAIAHRDDRCLKLSHLPDVRLLTPCVDAAILMPGQEDVSLLVVVNCELAEVSIVLVRPNHKSTHGLQTVLADLCAFYHKLRLFKITG